MRSASSGRQSMGEGIKKRDQEEGSRRRRTLKRRIKNNEEGERGEQYE